LIAAAPPAQRAPVRRFSAARALLTLEDGTASLALLGLAILPVVEVVLREVLSLPGIPAGTDYMRHLTLWVALAAGIITTRQGAHLSISSGLRDLALVPARVREWLRAASSAISVIVGTALACSSLSLVLVAFDPSMRVGFLSIRWATVILPIGFVALTLRFILTAAHPPALPGSLTADPAPSNSPAQSVPPTPQAADSAGSGNRGATWRRALVLAGVPLGLLLSSSALTNAALVIFEGFSPSYDLVDGVAGALAGLRAPLVVLLLLSAFVGAPIFVVISGFALLQFVAGGGVMEVVADEAYLMLTQPLVPALPLFTFTGFLLSESRAGERLIRVFRLFFGWFRGGLAVMVVIICAFFTTFTGASGVTILALGGLLVFMLKENGFPPRFAMGLLTAAGSIGLLFPPALPVIMYGVTAQIDIRRLFVGGFLPGVLMVATLAIYGIIRAPRRVKPAATAVVDAHVPRKGFDWREAGGALAAAGWELALPVVIIGLFFGGFASLVETASIATVYVLVIEVFVNRDLRLADLPRVLTRSLPIIGGVLIILAMAKGLSYYIIDTEAPFRLTTWLRAAVSSRVVFLILLNVTLLAAGALMDIFSAIVVLGPLLIPLGLSYGINEVHLGIIFLANLELGYLTPPVGINLFLASYRFERGLPELYRSVLPFLLMLLVAVLLITYVPVLTTGLLDLPLFQF
jgi:C4-dicarboxylate transporter DctM subunit